VIDTSIIVNGQIIKQVESGILNDTEIIIPVAVLDELQSQASQKKEQGFVGLEEIKRLQSFTKNGITVKFDGKRPSVDDIRLASHGRIDAIIKIKKKYLILTAILIISLVNKTSLGFLIISINISLKLLTHS